MVITIENIKSKKGQIALSLANSKSSYNGEYFIAEYIEAQKDKIVHELKDIPFGTYAIKVYHDKNGNEEIDTGMFGKPTEPYGFSNNASAMFGPAKWEDAKFKFDKDGQQIVITLK
jgi:uncharacterized protein (DUF2141 family)